MLRVNQDDLKVLVGRVLGNPVAVQDTQTTALAAGSEGRSGMRNKNRQETIGVCEVCENQPAGALLSLAAQAALELQLLHTLGGGLAVHGTLADRALAATALCLEEGVGFHWGFVERTSRPLRKTRTLTRTRYTT